ncbi:MAG: LysR substrate-binding domain-containing protein [Rubrivivax sp.]|jgi:LysR family transcriptional activator of dmlA
MPSAIHAADLSFFSVLAGAASLSAAARELGISTAAVSKHLAQMERRLGLILVTRSTRRMGLTPEGELYLQQARAILAQIDELEHRLGATKAVPAGLLRVNATLGFGRSHIAPLISPFVRRHPQVEVQLQLSVNPPPISDDSFDVCIRFGAPADGRVVARFIAPNRRLLCAAPSYLARHGTPKSPQDLASHACIGIRQGEDAYGLWRLSSGGGGGGATGKVRRSVSVKTRGPLTTNDGEIAVRWALEGHGILMRAEWDVERWLHSGKLVQVLPQWATPDADIYAVYPPRHQHAARVRVFVDAVEAALSRKFVQAAR